MASENKKRKLKNSYGVWSILKNKDSKLKRWLFFTASQRKHINKIDSYENENKTI